MREGNQALPKPKHKMVMFSVRFVGLVSTAAVATMLLIGEATSATLPPHHPQHRAPRALLDRIAKSNPVSLQGADPTVVVTGTPTRRAFTTGLRVSPVQFGADPTGVKDSWAALNQCLNHCLNQSKLSPNGFFPGQDSTPSFGPIRDMGGCDIDLEGGEYLISQPLILPPMNANMQFGRGSLVASKAFQGDFLFVVGEKGSCKVPQGSCNIDINFPELFLDGNHVASGLQINNVMGVTIGPGGYFLNFTAYGVQINAGHEVMMDRCWLGETNFDFDHVARGVAPNATAIQINGNDHYILNTVVFSSKIGLEVNGAADYITGVHVWFPVNHAVHFPDSIAFHNGGSGNRWNGCYMDGGRAIFTGGGLQETIWTNGFECCQGAAAAPGTTASGITLVGNTVGPGLQIINNEFGGGSIYHCTDEAFKAGQCAGPATVLARGFGNATASRSPTGGRSVTTAVRGCDGFNTSSNNKDCQDLQQTSATTLEECASSCCEDSGCTVYQFCAAGGKCDGASGTAAQCWTGDVNNCAGERDGWVGMSHGGVAPRPAGKALITGVRIAHNSFQHTAKTTEATQSLTQTNATQWMFDFCAQLLFPQIAYAKVHVTAASGFPTAVARPAQNCTLLVETSVAVTGTITVEVDSSQPSLDF
jgi:hypothetical protein